MPAGCAQLAGCVPGPVSAPAWARGQPCPQACPCRPRLLCRWGPVSSVLLGVQTPDGDWAFPAIPAPVQGPAPNPCKNSGHVGFSGLFRDTVLLFLVSETSTTLSSL